MSHKKTQIFIAYARKDVELLDQFRTHLRPLERAGKVQVWYDSLIEPGAVWEAQIKKNLHAADIVLLMVSADAIASDYFYDKEVADALERHRAGTARVVPMILRPCAWNATPLAELQAIPQNGKAVTTWTDRDEAYTDAAQSLLSMVNNIEQHKREQAAEEQRRQKEAAEAERLEERQAQYARHMAEARKCLRRRDGLSAINHAQAALAIEPGDAEALQLIRQAEHLRLQPPPPQPPYLRWAAIGIGALVALFLIARAIGGGGGENVNQGVYEEPISPAAPTPDMVFIRGGTFRMGCTSEQRDCDSDESPTFEATVSDFYLGRYEVTFEEYDAFCAATGRKKPYDAGWGRGKRPVINVSWYDAVEYCNWLSERHGLTPYYAIDKSRRDPNNGHSDDELKWTVTPRVGANGYRLPSEAEWEYAARGGGKSVLFGNGKNVADPSEINFYGGELLKKAYSVAGVDRAKTVPVGSLNSPNGLGLHDMSGNVWEWCWDWYGAYSSSSKTNPRGPEVGSNRVDRGGGWVNYPRSCRVAYRGNGRPALRGSGVGFRLARS